MPDYKTALFIGLQPFFEDHGFKYIPRLNQYRKTLDTKFQNVIPSISIYDDTCIIEVNIGVRINQVEELVHQFTTHTEAFKSDTNTLMISLGRLRFGKPSKYQASNSNQLVEVVEDIHNYMETEGFDFLNQVSSIQALDEILNDKPAEDSPYMYNYYYRCLRGITIAKLNNNINMDQIAETYYEQLEKQAAPLLHQDNFKKLYAYLRVFSMN